MPYFCPAFGYRGCIPSKERIKNLAYFALAGLPLTLLVQGWIYLTYHYTYLDWYMSGGGGSPGWKEFTQGTL
jgi:hypothetical protein